MDNHPSNEIPRLSLCLSGGGFRATFFHLGVVRFLKDAGLLDRVSLICSVSGGSILAAHLAQNWQRYLGDEVSFQAASDELVKFAQLDLRGRIIRRWILGCLLPIGPGPLRPFQRTQLLTRYYDRLFGRQPLRSLRDKAAGGPPCPDVHLLATSMTSGNLCFFTRDGFSIDYGDTVRHFPAGLLPLSLAVAASSAFPPLFPPVSISRKQLDASVAEFPYKFEHLTDGGVFDNLGIRHFHRLSSRGDYNIKTLIVSDASAVFDWDTVNRFAAVISRTVRTTDILMKRVADLEKEHVRWRSGLGAMEFVNLPIDDVVSTDRYADALDSDIQLRLKKIRTDLDHFSVSEISSLVRHGYGVAYNKFGAPTDPVYPQRTSRTLLTPDPKHTSLQLTKLVSEIERGRRRRLNLWNSKDIATWALLAIVAAAAGLPFTPWIIAREKLREESHQITLEKAALNKELDKIYTLAKVLVATVREKTDSPLPSHAFGTGRGDLQTLAFNVSIPPSHRMFAAERPSIWKLEFAARPEEHIIVRDFKPLPLPQFAEAVIRSGKSQRASVIFVHDWNTSFEDSVERAAAITYDLGLDGQGILFAWPSAGSLSAYLLDEVNALWSARSLEELISLMLGVDSGRKVSLVAVGMGCRIAMEAMLRPDSQRLWRVENLVLIVPDADTEWFVETIGEVSRHAGRVTIYTSPSDSGLRASASFHGAARFGGTSGVSIGLPNVDIVDVTGQSELGGDNRAVVYADVYQVLRNQAAAERVNLRRRDGGWILSRPSP